MIRAFKVIPGGSQAVATDTVTIDHDGRFRRRIVLKGEKGTEFLLDLLEAVALKDGDGLELEDGRVVLVKAADEDLIEVTARDSHHLSRLAWHIGNRHVPCQIFPDLIRIKPDHVIADMVIGLGGRVRDVRAPFQPEGGAYADSQHGNGHDHDHHHHGHHHGHHHD